MGFYGLRAFFFFFSFFGLLNYLPIYLLLVGLIYDGVGTLRLYLRVEMSRFLYCAWERMFFFYGWQSCFFTDLFTYLLICLFIYFHLIVVFKISGRVGLRILRFLWMANMSVCFRGDGGEFWNFFLLIALFLLVYSFLSFFLCFVDESESWNVVYVFFGW